MKLIVVKGNGREKEFRLHDGMNSVGRGVTNRIRLHDPRVSRRHCKIRKVGLSLFLMDLGTKNGTQVNGKSVAEQELRLFDEIKIGKTILKIVEEDYSPQLAPSRTAGCMIKHLFRSLFGNSESHEETSADGFSKFARRRRKRLWRPRPDTEPPDADSETAGAFTDPDS